MRNNVWLILFVILMLSFITGCRTLHKVTEQTQASTVAEYQALTQIGTGMQMKADGETQRVVDDIRSKTEDIEWEYTRTNYSPPDSTGRQYTQSVETGVLNATRKEEDKHREETDERYAVLASYVDSLSQKIANMESRQEYSRIIHKEKPSWWQRVKQEIGGLAIGALVGVVIGLIAWMAVRFKRK